MNNSERVKYFNDKKVMGIDPGKSNGGIVVYSITKNVLIEATPIPDTIQELLAFFKIYSKNCVCYIEKVFGRPGMGGVSMFTFGQNYGHLEMALFASGISTISVTPQKWQKEFQLGVKGNDSTTVWKNKLKTKAQQLYPRIKITLATSDAVLIMEYGRRIEEHEQKVQK